MEVIKRNGKKESFNPLKILNRIKKQSEGLKVNPDEIALETMQGIYDGITTIELDELSAKISHNYTFSHPDYSKLASNLIVSRLHKEIDSFYKTTKYLNKIGRSTTYNKIEEWIEKGIITEWNDIMKIIDNDLDYKFDYFGIVTLIRGYLIKDNGVLYETPQYMYMRIAIELADDINEVITYYNELSSHTISAATPILYNAGTTNPNMISCNLTYLKGDSIEEIMDTMKNISIASSDAAGIGLCIDNIRSSKTNINSTGGKAHGVLGLAKIVNELMCVYNQGGKRPGSCALYLSTWHKDIMSFLDLKLPNGEEKLRARDIFLAVNAPDNFMVAVEEDKPYYLFCPKELKNNGLSFEDKWGLEFESEYDKAVSLGIGEEVMAREIYTAIIRSEIETGVPYVHFVDKTNLTSNHNVYGKIKQSNLCIEIVQYSDEETTAQCCLGSIPIQNHVNGKKLNLKSLKASVATLVHVLNKVINKNKYSTVEAEKGGLEQRAIAIGIQGFADLIYKLDLTPESKETAELNKLIFETIYYSALEASHQVYKQTQQTYKSFEKSYYGQGILHPEHYGIEVPERYKNLAKNGLANSLLTACMPTASTAQILGSSESFEFLQSNMFIREAAGSEFLIVNKQLVYDLEELGIWCDELKDEILRNNGSIQGLDLMKYFKGTDYDGSGGFRIGHLMEKYKTIWELSQKTLIDLCKDRAPYIDQSQSMNLYLAEPNLSNVGSMLMYSWKQGLKTGIYYLRSKPKTQANKNLGLKRITNKPEKPKDSLFNCEGCSG